MRNDGIERLSIDKLKDSDVGRRVRYHVFDGSFEEGVITSWNDVNIFVRYGADIHSQSTTPSDLSWG